MSDRRTGKTDTAIKDAFFQLLNEKPVGKISIRLLCDKANINRSTFYDHYEDYPSFLDSLEYELADKCLESFLLYNYDLDSHDTVVSILAAVKTNKNLFALLFRDIPNNKARAILKNTLKELSISKWLQNSNIDREQAEIIFEYIMEGQFALLKFWHDSDYIIDEKKLEDIYENIIHNGLLYYTYKK